MSYQKLADHLDRLPGGFAPSSTGADLRLLQRLFTPQEAELAIHLTLEREEAKIIAQRAGLSPEKAETMLDTMAHKGLVFSIQTENKPTLYHAVPFVVGIYEFQINNLSAELLQDIKAFWSTQKPRASVQTIPQMRTIPVGQSITPHLEALPYEEVNKLVKAHDRFAVAPCICRRHAKLTGGGCDAPEESCLMFGDFADYYVRDGRGRAIDRAEVMEILVKADAANLVLQPTNSQDIAAICCCCGCCCGILGSLKRSAKPSEAVASAFIAQFEPEACLGCLLCLERCQMEAIAEYDDRVELNADRCIGCGLCVTTCPSGALTLRRKPSSAQTQPPVNMMDTWRIINQAQVR